MDPATVIHCRYNSGNLQFKSWHSTSACGKGDWPVHWERCYVRCGDIQLNLEALKLCKTKNNHICWSISVYMEVLRSLVPMPTGLTNKSLIFSHFGHFTNVWVCSGNFGFCGLGQNSPDW